MSHDEERVNGAELGTRLNALLVIGSIRLLGGITIFSPVQK
jgi:hypothetical protein